MGYDDVKSPKELLMKHIPLRILILVLTLSLLLGISSGAFAASALTDQEYTLHRLLNEDRARYGLNPLILDEELSRIARIKSQDMVTNRYFAHLSPTYGNVRSMLSSFGVSYLSAGENIARSRSVQHSNAAFISSEGHRRNMLSKSYTHVGIGVVTDPNGFVTVTEIFVRKQ